MCFRQADATAGEARALAAMARSESWYSMTVLIKRHHVFSELVYL